MSRHLRKTKQISNSRLEKKSKSSAEYQLEKNLIATKSANSKNQKNQKIQFLRKVFVENQETLSAGVIAGGSLIGIILTLLEVFVLN